MRGDIFRLRAPRDVIGREQRGDRYGVVVQSDNFPRQTLIIVPTSTSAADAPFRPEIMVRDVRTRALAEQVMVVSLLRLGKPVGSVTHEELADIDEALRLVLALD